MSNRPCSRPAAGSAHSGSWKASPRDRDPPHFPEADPPESSTFARDICNSSDGLKPTGTPARDGDVQGGAAAPVQMSGSWPVPARLLLADVLLGDTASPHVRESSWHTPHARLTSRSQGAASCTTPAFLPALEEASQAPPSPRGQLGRGHAGPSVTPGTHRLLAAEAAAQDPASHSPPPCQPEVAPGPLG